MSKKGKTETVNCVVVCGPHRMAIGDRLDLRRPLHDNGFGWCFVTRDGVQVWNYIDWARKYGFDRLRRAAYFEQLAAETNPMAHWCIEFHWPFSQERFVRVGPGEWRLTQIGRGIAG